jgi:flavorubredoxin
METSVHEIAPRIHRLSTYVADVMPGGFSFNQFLIDADQPLLFHCGMRGLFAQVSAAASRVVPLERLRWISFGHVEADENGSMNDWLAAAPQSQVLHGEVGCMVSLNDLADRPPRPLAHGARLDLGGRRVHLLCTPHVPHAWESIVLFEEVTRTLFCGDLFSQTGNGPPVTEKSIVGAAMNLEHAFPGGTALTPATAPTLRSLAKLHPQTLAVMHGSSYRGDCASELRALANGYERMFDAARAAEPDD